MTYTSIISASSIALLVLYMLYISFGSEEGRKGIWVLPAGLSILFAIYSIQTMVTEGGLGFWAQHTSSLWGTQIWVDLLIAIGIGWYFVVPKAKKLGMRTGPWVLIILASGCIGFLMMLARVFYLQEKRSAHQAVV